MALPVPIAALVTAGGRGSRLKQVGAEKPLILVDGRYLIDRVLEVISSSRYISTVYVSVSPHTPETKRHLSRSQVKVIDTPGEGYVPDLHAVMDQITDEEVLICPSDMPLLTVEAIDAFIEEYLRRGEPSLTVALPPSAVRDLGLEVTYSEMNQGRELTYCGISMLHRQAMIDEEFVPGGYYVTELSDFAINVNTERDLRIAERILGERERGQCFPRDMRRE